MKMKNLQQFLCMIVIAVMLFGYIPAFAVTASAEQVVSVEYFGRNALATLDNASVLLYAYDKIVEGVTNAQEEIIVYDGNNNISVEEVKLVFDTYKRDYTNHFWLGNQYRYSSYSEDRAVAVYPSYTMTGEELATAKVAFEQTVETVLAGITDTMSEYDIELYLHDALAQIATYTEATNAHNAYGALVEGKTVCEGYAEALQYLLQRAGIQSFQIHGDGIDLEDGTTEPHAWNLVRIDGAYYHTDLTWDDPGEDIFHAYFNVSDAVILEDHLIDETPYALPVCDSVAAQYFTGKDTYMNAYTAETVGRLLIENDLSVHLYIPGSVNEFKAWCSENIWDIATAAGISEGFSISYKTVGHETIFSILGMTAAVTLDGDTAAYSTLAKALQNSGENAALRLLADAAEDVSVTKAMGIDLNGFSITGDLIATAKVTVWDSETDDYTVANGDGYGRITGTVTGITTAEGYRQITETDGTSFHKVDLALKTVNLRAKDVGIYYTAAYRYDEVVARNLDAKGVTLSTQNSLPVADDSDPTSLYTVTEKSTLLKDFMDPDAAASANQSNAKTPVYARAYMKLKDGTYLYSEANTATFRQVVKAVDAHAWDKLTQAQKDSVLAMYAEYSDVMANWKLENIK